MEFRRFNEEDIEREQELEKLNRMLNYSSEDSKKDKINMILTDMKEQMIIIESNINQKDAIVKLEKLVENLKRCTG